MARPAGGVELRGIVDEQDEPAGGAAGAGEPGHAHPLVERFVRLFKLEGFDPDMVCAYKTFKIVRIRDRNLGLLYWFIVLVVCLYVGIVAFCIEGKASIRVPGIPTTIFRFKGKAFVKGTDRVYDQADLRWPSVEPSGAFIWTKRITVPQTRGNCADMDSPQKCGDGAPCPGGVPCQDQHCVVAGWCPSLGEINAKDPPPEAEIEHLEGLEHAHVQIVTSITFPGIANRLYVAGGTPGTMNPLKNITLGELIALAEPRVTLQEVSEKGALIGVNFLWSCDINLDCEPIIVVKYLDAGTGFVQKRARIGRTNGQESREAIYMYGIRIMVESAGIGRSTSLVLIVIQVGSGIALLRTASICADFLMLQLYSEEKKKAYYKCKVLETSDFSDLVDRLNLVHSEEEADRERATLLGRSEKTQNGSNLPLALGPHRSSGTSMLRGRGATASSAAS